jgi:PIN domain nuclease of toxin-antitoxin system
MSAVVLDASAVLAVINGEPGADTVIASLSDARICAVNYAEVISKLVDKHVELSDALDAVTKLGVSIVDFDADLAASVGALRPATKGRRISLADRACLALAGRDGIPALTGDRRWASLSIAAQVRLFR